MRWTKLGRVHIADASGTWMTSHASMPTPYGLSEEAIRVYVAFFDHDDIARIGFVDVAVEDPRKILRVSDHPALDVGVIGAFDEHGVTPSAVIAEGATVRLYYSGSQRAINVPHLSFAGLAVSEDGGNTFERVSRAPVLSRVDGERMRRSAPTVARVDGIWHAWYVAADTWIDLDGRAVPKSEIRTTSSEDGIRWCSAGNIALEVSGDDEVALGRPFVSLTDDGYSMWFSLQSRSGPCRIGFATSEDGVSWRRRDEDHAIDVSQAGSDRQAACFGAVFSAPSDTYLFYDGSRSGEPGFDVASFDAG
jgi:hypothetical protein